jgi:hypothetical protein
MKKIKKKRLKIETLGKLFNFKLSILSQIYRHPELVSGSFCSYVNIVDH